MNSLSEEQQPWTRTRWAMTIAGLFLLEYALVLLLADRTQVIPREAKTTLRVSLISSPEANRKLADLAIPADPTLFALANRREFTGLAWQRPATAGPHLPEWTESTGAPWSNSPTTLGAAPSSFLRSNAPAPLSVAAHLAPSLEGVVTSSPPVRTFSTLRIEGTLAQRKTLAVPSVPSWPHPDLLTNTVVRLTVNGEGLPISSFKIQTSGSPGADDKAVSIARSLRFQPTGAEQLEDGFLIFEWHTTLPAAPKGTGATP